MLAPKLKLAHSPEWHVPDALLAYAELNHVAGRIGIPAIDLFVIVALIDLGCESQPNRFSRCIFLELGARAILSDGAPIDT